MIVGMFMAVLDIQIVAISLSVIAAGLSVNRTNYPGYKPHILLQKSLLLQSLDLSPDYYHQISYFITAVGFTIMSLFYATLGGYITEIFSLHFMFLLNLLPVPLFSSMLILINQIIIYKKNFDYLGIILMAVSL